MQSPTRDFYTIYEKVAFEIEHPRAAVSFWLLLLRATGIFITITLIVFCIANYQFIRSQIAEWRGRHNGLSGALDRNKNSLPDWWEQQYALDMSGAGLAFEDNDSDGANNLVEYEFSTSPLDPDTDKDGFSDGEEIHNGYDPNGVGRLDLDKDGIYDWWEDKSGLDKSEPSDAGQDWDNDQLTNLDEFHYLTDPRNADSDFDGKLDAKEISEGLNPMGRGNLAEVSKRSVGDADKDGLYDLFENLFGTDAKVADSDQDGYDDFSELKKGYDPTAPGDARYNAEVFIPSIDVNAPLVWSQSEDKNKIQEDLEKGIIHYFGTAFPGQRGNMYITGHSSNYAWSKSPYKDVLRKIGDIKVNDQIVIRFALGNNRKIDITYRVRSSEVVLPVDSRLFRDYEGYEMTLVSCWPVGTDWKRMMIKAQLEGPKPE